MDAIELHNRLRNFTHRMVSLCESIPLRNECRIFEHQLLSFAYSIDTPVHMFPHNDKPLHVSLNIAFDEIRQALFQLKELGDSKLISLSQLPEIKRQGDGLAAMFGASVFNNQNPNRNN